LPHADCLPLVGALKEFLLLQSDASMLTEDALEVRFSLFFLSLSSLSHKFSFFCSSLLCFALFWFVLFSVVDIVHH